MNPNDVIAAKNSGRTIPTSDLHDFISGYVKGSIDDATMTQLLQAILDKGMSAEEIFTMVDIMIHSGQCMDFSNDAQYVADKHSTGGVGDKVSLVLAPLLAAAGIKIPMISGRSLGHTGGTVDKLETIPGFRTDVSLQQFHEWVDDIGFGIMAQSAEICPADGKIYALRDVTGTIASAPLICGSIMSKKIASGIEGLVLDIKVGSGGFMPTLSAGKELGEMLKDVGEHFGVKTDLVYTNMDQPLGCYSGMWCEVQEAMDCLAGKGPADTMAVTLKLAAKLMIQSKLAETEEESDQLLNDLLTNGKALEKFHQFIDAQGGSLEETNNEPRFKIDVPAKADGFIESIDTTAIGWGLTDMGCGRRHKNDILDPTAGLECIKKIGDPVHEGDIIFQCFCCAEEKLKEGVEKIANAVTISSASIEQILIYN